MTRASEDTWERVSNAEEVGNIVQQRLDSMLDDEQVYRTPEAHRVPYALVFSVERAMREPHLREREIVRTVNDRFVGELELPGFPLRFSEFPRHLELEAPTLGEHNVRFHASCSDSPLSRIEQLEQAGILVRGRS